LAISSLENILVIRPGVQQTWVLVLAFW